MAKKRVGKFPNAFRQYAVDRMKHCDNIAVLAKELGIHRRLLYIWRDQLEPAAGEFSGADAAPGDQPFAAGPGDEDAGGGFFQRCLAHSTGSTPAERRCWRDGLYAHIRDVMSQQGSLRIERLCQLAGVSRAGFYRSWQQAAPVEEEMAVRAEIQQIALAHRRRYGYRRITAELRRRGLLVNHKRVARLMREDNLLAVQPKAFVVTTDARHDFEVYLNLASRLTLTGIDQLWVADITYIRLQAEFVYLAVILDGFSRRVVGWALDKTLATRLPLGALQQALTTRQPRPGAVHHSDRGIQYASGAYVQVLRQHQMIPSMSRPANPYDNASCESFMKTLKREEIYVTTYRDLEHLRGSMTDFIDQYYNRLRLHSALGYRPPEEFEQAITSAPRPGAATLQLFRPDEDLDQEKAKRMQRAASKVC